MKQDFRSIAKSVWFIIFSTKFSVGFRASNLSRIERLQSPCTFPTPLENDFYDECIPVYSYAVCDPSTIIFAKDLERIEELVVSLAETFRITQGVVLVFLQTLAFPDENKEPEIWSCYPRNLTRFYTEAQWARRPDETTRLVQETADILRERWFGICHGSLVVLIVDRVEGVKKPKKLPYFALSHNFLHLDSIFEANLNPDMESFLEVPRLSNARVSRSAIGLLEEIIRVVRESKAKIAKDNSIPTWAMGAFTSCFVIVIICLLIEKFCLANAEAQKKSQMKRSARKEQGGESWKMGGLLASAIRKQAETVSSQAKI